MRQQQKQALSEVSCYGRMARGTGSNKPKTTITKSNILSNAVSFTTTLASAGDSLYANGNFSNVSISGSLGSLYPSGIPSIFANYDKFRLRNVEIFLSNHSADPSFSSSPELTVYASVDIDDALPTTWDVFRSRKNVSMNSTNMQRPLICLASFRPRANFAVSTGTSTPSNVVPNPDTWFDCSALNQQFVGLKLHVAGPLATVNTFSLFARVEIEFMCQV